MKDKLSHALPKMPGHINKPAEENDGTSLRSVVKNPPRSLHELVPLSTEVLTGFQLKMGSISKDEISRLAKKDNRESELSSKK